MYPGYLDDSIQVLEATRVRRLIETVPRLAEEEKLVLLKLYHPDYIEASMRQLQVGEQG